MNLALNFNFNDSIASAKALGQRLLSRSKFCEPNRSATLQRVIKSLQATRIACRL